MHLAINENDEQTLKELDQDIANLTTQIDNLESQRMFTGPMDSRNAYLDIQSGAGGTEAQDWAEMFTTHVLTFWR